MRGGLAAFAPRRACEGVLWRKVWVGVGVRPFRMSGEHESPLCGTKRTFPWRTLRSSLPPGVYAGQRPPAPKAGAALTADIPAKPRNGRETVIRYADRYRPEWAGSFARAEWAESGRLLRFQ